MFCTWMHRETDVTGFFCECVNSMRTRIERRCVLKTIKFNDRTQTRRLTCDRAIELWMAETMNTFLTRELRHGSMKLGALMLPVLLMAACESGVSGHAPGLAGVQT